MLRFESAEVKNLGFILYFKVGVRRTSEDTLKFTLDGHDLGVAVANIPKVPTMNQEI